MMTSLRARLQGLFVKLGLVLLLGMVAICVVEYFFALWGGIAIFDEIAQRSGFSTATELANEIQPALLDRIDEQAVRAAIQRMEHENPTLRGYLLDGDGHVLIASVPVAQLRTRSISPAIVETTLSFVHPAFPVYAAEPSVGSDRTFAAERIRIDGTPGYVVVTFFPPVAEHLRSGAGIRELSRRLAPTFLVATVVTTACLIILAFYMSRRFRQFVAAANALSEGNYDTVVPFESDDTLGYLATRFNSMKHAIATHDHELAERERKRRLLLANVAHDLRVPLAVIRGLVELFLRDGGAPSFAEAKRHVEAIRRNVERQRGFSANLEELARFELEDASRELTVFSLRETVHGVIESFVQHARENGIKLVASLPSETAEITADKLWIERMLINLVGNAIRYTPAGGDVLVRLASDRDGELCLSVSDTGIGIPEDAIPRLFDEFYRVPRRAEEDPGGTGLGLAIVKRIVEFHSGEIRVESAEGRGTTFRVSLPRAPIRGPNGAFLQDGQQMPQDGRSAQSMPGASWRGRLRGEALLPHERRKMDILVAVAGVLAVVFVSADVAPGPLLTWFLALGLTLAGGWSRARFLLPGTAAASLWAIRFSDPLSAAIAVIAAVGAVVLFARLMSTGSSRLQALPLNELAKFIIIGAHFSGLFFLLPPRPMPSYAYIAGLLSFCALSSLVFLMRSHAQWLALLTPVLAGYLQFERLYPKTEASHIGLSAGLILGTVVISLFFQARGRVFDFRVGTLFGVIIALAFFVIVYKVTRSWREIAQHRLEAEAEPLIRRMGAEIAGARASGDPAAEVAVFERFIRYFHDQELARFNASGRMLECTNRNFCDRRDASGLEPTRTRFRTAPLDLGGGLELYRQVLELGSLLRLRLAVPGNEQEFLLLKTGSTSLLARQTEGMYAFYGVLISSVMATLLGMVLRLTMMQTVTRRLTTLESVMRDLERGDEMRRFPVGKGDEIDRLGVALNAMADERVRGRAALRVADARRRQLVIAIVEALREPMKRLDRAMGELTRSLDRGDAGSARGAVEEIGSVAALQAEVVEDLFLLSKLEIAKEIPLTDLVGVEEMIEDVVDRVRQTTPNRTFIPEIESSLPFVRMNLLYLARSLGDLLEYAGFESEPGATIVVRASADQSRVVFEIRSFDVSGSSATAVRRGATVGAYSLRLTLAERVFALHGGRLVRGDGQPLRAEISRERIDV